MQHSDVIVVGGGPGGSTCARRLVEHGASVRVLDAAVFPRDKVCAGWITPQVIDAVQLDVDEYRSGRTWQDLTAFRVGSVGDDDAVSVDFGSRVSAGIRRCEFDTFLLQRSGAAVQTGTPVRSIRREAGLWVVDDRWVAPLLIGAAGSACPVAKMLNGPMAKSIPVVVARETEFLLDAGSRDRCRVASGVAELYFTADLVGYGWCVRKGDWMNVGIGRLGRHLPRTEVEAFGAFVRSSRGVVVPGLETWRGHAYLAGASPGHRRTGEGVLLVGDAAGLASDRSGEGIGPAIDSALMAADLVADANGDFSAVRLARYDAMVAARWQRADPLAQITRVIPTRVLRTMVAPLLRSRAFVENVVLTRWFLHSQDRLAAAA
jgi:flavin-dependent dehydrogenase